MQGLLVIDRNLFTRFDIPQREEQHVAVQSPHVSVGPTTVIDVVSAVAAARSVQAPTSVDVTDAQNPPIAGSLLCFKI